MPDIIAVVDLGKSLGKSIWKIPSTVKKQLIFLEPEIVSLTREDIANISRENADPEKDAWLVFPDGTGEALGFVTRTSRYRNRRDVAKDELKSLHGVNRCLAILGAIAPRSGLTNDSDGEETEFSVALSVPDSIWSIVILLTSIITMPSSLSTISMSGSFLLSPVLEKIGYLQ